MRSKAAVYGFRTVEMDEGAGSSLNERHGIERKSNVFLGG